MKNKFLISCAATAAAGVVLAIAGFVTGGWIYGIGADWKGIHVYAPALEEKNKDTGSGMMKQSEELPQTFESIQIRAEYADIRVERTDGDAYSLSYDLPGYCELLKEVKDGKLLLTMQLRHSAGFGQVKWFWFGLWPGNGTGTSESETASITVLVPKDAKLSEAFFLTDSGNITCKGIQADTLQATAAYGDINLMDIQAREMEMKLEAGNLQMEQAQGGSCTVTNEYGDALFENMALAGDMKIYMESGDIRFHDTTMRGLELKNAYGSVNGEQTVFEQMQMSVESGDCSFFDLAFDSLSIQEEYGDVDLKLRRDVSDYGYELRTEYGEIEIEGQKMGDTYVTLEENQKPFLKIICESGNIEIQNTKS